MIVQKWEGYVHDIDEFAGEFGVVLRDITDPDNGDEYCTLRINDIPEHINLQLGLIFNWTIEVDDQGVGKSTIRFSEEKWTAEEITRINEEAKEMTKKIGLPFPPPNF